MAWCTGKRDVDHLPITSMYVLSYGPLSVNSFLTLHFTTGEHPCKEQQRLSPCFMNDRGPGCTCVADVANDWEFLEYLSGQNAHVSISTNQTTQLSKCYSHLMYVYHGDSILYMFRIYIILTTSRKLRQNCTSTYQLLCKWCCGWIAASWLSRYRIS